MKRLLFAALFMAACSSGGHDVSNHTSPIVGSQNDAAPPLIVGEIPCGTGTCGDKQICYTVCNDAPVCLDAPSGFENECQNIFESMLCTSGGSCDPNNRVATCACPQGQP